MENSNKNEIFRKKSLDKISSPEELDKYIKTTTPSFIILFISVITLLSGLLVWSLIGKIETKSEIGFSVVGGSAVSYIKESDYSKLTEESFLKYDNQSFEIKEIAQAPVQANEASDNYLLHIAEISIGEWYYEVYSFTTLADGNYAGAIVFESISPFSFIF